MLLRQLNRLNAVFVFLKYLIYFVFLSFHFLCQGATNDRFLRISQLIRQWWSY